ncbi:MAG: hypothetical protein J0M26_06415 [Planctomycetes bacterium]|nr:hypothetical protein [Planctomycetota bacterium]
MSERKSLASSLMTAPNQSLDSDLVRQFVKTGVEQKPIRETSVESKKTLTDGMKTEVDENSKRHVSKKMSKGTHEELPHSRIRPMGLVPVTVRLTPNLAGALKRASLERELAGESFFTQQDIVQSLLEPWLKREGYL